VGLPRLEKRGSTRVAVTLTGHCRIGNRHLRDAVADLSEGGLYLQTREPAPVGTPVRMALALPLVGEARICTLVGVVAWRELDGLGRQRGLGVSFDAADMVPADRRSLLGFISDRQAPSPP
jgi:uncharacterized protein (TIGR02266 family)